MSGESSLDPGHQRRRASAGALLLTFIAYTLAASLGLQWAQVAGAASPIWPAAGIAVVAIVTRGPWMALPVVLGLVLASRLTGATLPLWSQFAMGIGNAAAAMVASALLRRSAQGKRISFGSVRSITTLVIAAVAGAMLSATVGIAALIGSTSLPLSAAAQTFLTWSLGDLSGILLVTPICLAWSAPDRRTGDRVSPLRLLLVLSAVALLGALVFMTNYFPRGWAAYPTLVWAALALRTRDCSIALLLTAAIAIIGTHQGLGPFSLEDGRNPLLVLQLFLAVTSATILFLSAAVEERDSESQLRAAREAELSVGQQLTRYAERAELAQRAAHSSLYEIDVARGLVERDHYLLELAGYTPGGVGTAPEDWIALIHPDDRDDVLQTIAKAHQSADRYSLEYRISRADSGIMWLSDVGHLIRDDEGIVVRIVGISTDISERKLAEEREKLLAREVDHRAKNLLAVVQSIVQLTGKDDSAAFQAGVSGRIHSLARAHSLLAASRWEGVELTDLAVEELAPYALDGQELIDISGPAVSLKPAAAQSIAMALHELATNAVKYGALKDSRGRLTLQWERSRDNGLELRWRETGTGPISPPVRKGFGERVIAASIERQLGGSIKRDWGNDGLKVTIRLPASQLVEVRFEADLREEVTPVPQQLPDEEAPNTNSRRLLIVEDEALIALEMEQVLAERGFHVVGIAASVAEGLALAQSAKPALAVLDLNLGGEMSFPVADALIARGCRLVFCTGYDGDRQIPLHLAAIPVLRKPFDPDEITTALTVPHEVPR